MGIGRTTFILKAVNISAVESIESQGPGFMHCSDVHLKDGDDVFECQGHLKFGVQMEGFSSPEAEFMWDEGQFLN